MAANHCEPRILVKDLERLTDCSQDGPGVMYIHIVYLGIHVVIYLIYSCPYMYIHCFYLIQIMVSLCLPSMGCV